MDESFDTDLENSVVRDPNEDGSPPLHGSPVIPPRLEPRPPTSLQIRGQETMRRDVLSSQSPGFGSRSGKPDAWRTKTFEPVVFADDDIAVDVMEESPPPHLAISPSLLSKVPVIPLASSHSPIPIVRHGDDLEPIPAPLESDISVDDRLHPLTSQYARSLYPLPMIESQKKRKKEARRTTTSGTPVVDLTRWEAIMVVNPTSRLAKKAGKCLTTSEWQVRIGFHTPSSLPMWPSSFQVMFNEVRYVKAMRRINELKAQGIWSFRQPKKQKGPSLYKSHQDYLLEEMVNSNF